jgi:hypothetical protein
MRHICIIGIMGPMLEVEEGAILQKIDASSQAEGSGAP